MPLAVDVTEAPFSTADAQAQLPQMQMIPLKIDVTGIIMEGTRRVDERVEHLAVGFGAHPYVALGDTPLAEVELSVPAGLEALWRRYGRLAWARLVDPALKLARNGVEMPPAHIACLVDIANRKLAAG